MSLFPEEHLVTRIDQFAITAEQLSADQQAFLKSLNDKLAEIEQGIKQEVMPLIATGNQKVADPNDWIEDFEIECFITFCLNENDPDFRDDRDNILQKLSEYVKHKDWQWGMADDNNHNEFEHWDHPMRNEHHCWLYHCLYDHTDLGWANILRIGMVWIDINVVYQKFVKH